MNGFSLSPSLPCPVNLSGCPRFPVQRDIMMALSTQPLSLTFYLWRLPGCVSPQPFFPPYLFSVQALLFPVCYWLRNSMNLLWSTFPLRCWVICGLKMKMWVSHNHHSLLRTDDSHMAMTGSLKNFTLCESVTMFTTHGDCICGLGSSLSPWTSQRKGAIISQYFTPVIVSSQMRGPSSLGLRSLKKKKKTAPIS